MKKPFNKVVGTIALVYLLIMVWGYAGLTHEIGEGWWSAPMTLTWLVAVIPAMKVLLQWLFSYSQDDGDQV